eukprot:CAMPEP_0206498818 /NCGR_PEP_ID=MMETSP0324_2-20121206/51283_1 /ASSEMBLY_ACC=CAM_ASM_000836 /TAXON_ID=2866 /ORGANISM="Crypthecodinium cohnii, Strain Seligo" /LENGTH=131 /DNA_ID=CAMNT_0053985203 /DNA_START=151 /DNA_END=546 /DNA_ORIENTATION=+
MSSLLAVSSFSSRLMPAAKIRCSEELESSRWGLPVQMPCLNAANLALRASDGPVFALILFDTPILSGEAFKPTPDILLRRRSKTSSSSTIDRLWSIGASNSSPIGAELLRMRERWGVTAFDARDSLGDMPD